MKRLVDALAILLTCAVIAVTADALRPLGVSLYTEQLLAALLAIAMPIIFLHVPAGGARDGRQGAVPWYDIAAAALSFATLAYIAIRFPALSELVAEHPVQGLVPAAIAILLILDGLRRTTGNALLYTTIFFFVLALFAGQLPGQFAAKSIPLERLTYYSVWDSTAVLGTTLKIVSTVVVVFVLFGQVLLKSGGAAFFTDVAIALMGRHRGGPAKVAIIGSSLFGTISGNVVSNIIAVGVVTIPLMVRVGFCFGGVRPQQALGPRDRVAQGPCAVARGVRGDDELWRIGVAQLQVVALGLLQRPAGVAAEGSEILAIA